MLSSSSVKSRCEGIIINFVSFVTISMNVMVSLGYKQFIF
jgi:hypothetical protein